MSLLKEEIKRPDLGIIDKLAHFNFLPHCISDFLKFRQTAFVFIDATACLVRLMTLKSQFCQMVEDFGFIYQCLALVALRRENIELTFRWNVAKQAKRNI